MMGYKVRPGGAWFEAYFGGRWYTFDARHNKPRIGRILMARGRDATDVAIVTSFGPCTLAGFKVITDEVTLCLFRESVTIPAPVARTLRDHGGGSVPSDVRFCRENLG